MELARTDGVGLEVLDTDQTIDGDLAWNIAQLIADADNDIRLAKGKFWNRCKRGTREEICDHFGWSYRTMEEYGMFAREIPGAPGISYTHWYAARRGGINKTDRPKWLERTADEEWTPKQLTDAIKRDTEVTPELVKDDPKKAAEVAKKQAEDAAEKRKKYWEKHSSNGEAKDTSRVTRSEALAFLGIEPLTKETLEVVYKHYAKKYHTDTGNGNNDQMVKLNKCKEALS